MCAYHSNIEFRAFFIEMVIWSFNANCLDGSKVVKQMGFALLEELSTFLMGSGCFRV